MNQDNDTLRAEYEREGGPDLHPDHLADRGLELMDVFFTAVGFLILAALIWKWM